MVVRALATSAIEPRHRREGRRVVGAGDVDGVGLGDRRPVAVAHRDREDVAGVLGVVQGLDRRRVLGVAVGAGGGVDRQRAVGADQLTVPSATVPPDDAVGQRLDVDVGADQRAGEAAVGGAGALVDLGDRAGLTAARVGASSAPERLTV